MKNQDEPTSVFKSSWMFAFREDGYVIGKKLPPIQSDITICLYFPDFQQVFYQTVSASQSRSRVLETLVKQAIRQKLHNNNLLNHELSLKYLGKEQPIAPNSQLYFYMCERVVVTFKPPLIKQKKPDQTFLFINSKIDQRHQIALQSNRKFRVKQLYAKFRLNKISFHSLLVGNTLVHSYQTLQNIKLPSGIHPAYPLFSIQVFNNHMQQVYQILQRRKFNFSSLIYHQSMENKYKLLLSPTLNKDTHFTILYLMGNEFKQGEQQRLVDDLMAGKIHHAENNQSIQRLAIMVKSIENLPNDDSKTIYIIEQIQQQNLKINLEEGQFARMETFYRASNKLIQLKNTNNYHMYKIEHLTAKDVSFYSGFQKQQLSNQQYIQYTHLILPFTEYYVMSKEAKYSTLVEMPIPKRLSSHLILYISKDINKIFQQVKKQQGFQIMPIRSKKIYEIYLKKYYCLISSRKCCVIYNNKNVDEAAEIIALTQQHLGTQINIMICIKDSNQLNNLRDKYQGQERIKMNASTKAFKSFITSSFQEKDPIEQRPPCQCVIS